MNMIRHHDPGIEIHVRTAARHLHPLFGDDFPKIRKNHFARYDLA